MAEPLKNSFGADVPQRIAAMVEAVYPEFPSAEFIAYSLAGYDDLELTPRARRISAALARYLPPEPTEAIKILVASLGPVGERGEGMESFIYLPHVYFVADYGIDHLEPSLRAQYELTKRFTAEFSIRAFVDRYPDETLARLREWATDSDVHVRRLVSEGTRPRLPWAPRLKRFQQDPQPVLDLLELLKDDPEEYVRRSVSNNLNDIAKDHPELAVTVCKRWWEGASEQRRRLVRHGLRTLVKQGHPGALEVLGYSPSAPVTIERLTASPAEALIGDAVAIEALVRNDGADAQPVLVDVRLHFVKANGSTSPKVFKGGNVVLAAGASTPIRTTVSLAQHTTRTHYAGRHRVEAIVNGRARAEAWFDVQEPTPP